MDPKPKPTSRTPMKPATGKVPTTAAGAATKGNTSRIQKKGTERVPTGTARATSRKKNNPIVLVGLGVLVLGIVVAVYLFVRDPRIPPEVFAKMVREREGTAASAGHPDDGIARYTELIGFIESNGYAEEYSRQRAEYKGFIADLKRVKAEGVEIERLWGELKAAYDKVVAGTGDKREWIAEARKRAELFLGRPFYDEFKQARERVEQLIKKEDDEANARKFDNFRPAMLHKHKYQDDLDGFWGPALIDYRAYVARTDVTQDDKAKAQNEMNTIEGRARDGLARHRARAGRLEKAEAKKYLEARREQFKGTAVEAEFNQLIQSYS